MRSLIRTRDCEPLSPTAGARLSVAQLRSLQSAQRVLLAPLDHHDLESWRMEVVRAVSEALGGDAGAFELHLPGEAPEVGVGVPQDRLGEWVDHLPSLPEGFDLHERMLRLRVGTRFTTWGRHLEWFYDTAYFNEFLSKVGGYDPLALTTAAPGPAGNANLRVHHTTLTGPRFGAVELEMARLLHPAFEAGVATVIRTAASRSSLTTALDASPNGALVFDRGGRLLHQTPAVARLTGTHRGERAVIETGRAMARGLASVDPCDALDPGHAARTVHEHAGTYRLSAVLLGEGVFALQPAVLVTVTRPDAPLPDRATLRERFGLTRRQAEVALLLAQRKTDPEIAELLCISPYTARGHAEAVMGKLGIHSRRDIALMIAEPEQPTVETTALAD